MLPTYVNVNNINFNHFVVTYLGKSAKLFGKVIRSRSAGAALPCPVSSLFGFLGHRAASSPPTEQWAAPGAINQTVLPLV